MPKCPACGIEGAYVGFSTVECGCRTCQNYAPAMDKGGTIFADTIVIRSPDYAICLLDAYDRVKRELGRNPALVAKEVREVLGRVGQKTFDYQMEALLGLARSDSMPCPMEFQKIHLGLNKDEVMGAFLPQLADSFYNSPLPKTTAWKFFINDLGYEYDKKYPNLLGMLFSPVDYEIIQKQNATVWASGSPMTINITVGPKGPVSNPSPSSVGATGCTGPAGIPVTIPIVNPATLPVRVATTPRDLDYPQRPSSFGPVTTTSMVDLPISNVLKRIGLRG